MRSNHNCFTSIQEVEICCKIYEQWTITGPCVGWIEKTLRKSVYTSTDSSFTPLVLCGHALHTHPSLIDVFVGSYYEGVLVNECGHNLNPGWVGSVPYREGMTYQDLRHELNSPMFPVSLKERGGGGGILCIFVHFATCNLVSTFSPPLPTGPTATGSHRYDPLGWLPTGTLCCHQP